MHVRSLECLPGLACICWIPDRSPAFYDVDRACIPANAGYSAPTVSHVRTDVPHTTGLNYYRANFQLERFAATRPERRMAALACPVMGVWCGPPVSVGWLGLCCAPLAGVGFQRRVVRALGQTGCQLAAPEW
jgi:hypothetical protein